MSSLSKRLFDLARANLNALLDRAGEGPMNELSDEQLHAELERRRQRREREQVERRQREAAERTARERAAERSAQGRTRQESRSASATPPSSERRLRELYAQLEVPYGASFDEVKRSFRRLMRKYHPDLHADSPKAHQAATQLTMSLTQAYNELEERLLRKDLPNR